MSVEAMAVVLHHSKSKGTDKVVLLGIANHEGDGGSFPAVATLAKYANVNERATQYAIQRLMEAGELSVEVNAGGTLKTSTHQRPNLYRVLVRCPLECDRTSNHRLTTGVQPAAPGATDCTGGVQPAAPPPVQPAAPEPSTEPEVEPEEISALDAREDIQVLCAHFSKSLEERECVKTSISKKGKDAFRLMIDKDKITPERIMACIDWVTTHEFWSSVILCPAKMRAQYDKLRLAAKNEMNGKRGSHRAYQDPTDLSAYYEEL